MPDVASLTGLEWRPWRGNCHQHTHTHTRILAWRLKTHRHTHAARSAVSHLLRVCVSKCASVVGELVTHLYIRETRGTQTPQKQRGAVGKKHPVTQIKDFGGLGRRRRGQGDGEVRWDGSRYDALWMETPSKRNHKVSNQTSR